MPFHSRQKECQVRPQVTTNLSYTVETKSQGVHITETLKWNTHVQSLANTLSKVSLMIKSLKEIVIPFTIRNIYFFRAWGGVVVKALRY
jgi:hypothetical protein